MILIWLYRLDISRVSVYIKCEPVVKVVLGEHQLLCHHGFLTHRN